jgi:hypothetical protein
VPADQDPSVAETMDDASLAAAIVPPKLLRFAAIGPAAMGLLLAYVAFFAGGMSASSQTKAGTLVLGAAFVVGVLEMLLAEPIARGRLWAVVAGIVVSLPALGLAVVLLLGGAVAGAIGVGLGLVSLVLLGMSVPPGVRRARARKEIALQHPEQAFIKEGARSTILWGLATIGIFAVLAGAAAWRARGHKTPDEQFKATALGRALGEPLTNYVVALGRDSPNNRAASARDELLSKEVEAQVGSAGFAQLREVLERAKASRGESGDDTSPLTALWASVNAFDATLALRGVPAYLGAYSASSGDGRTVWLLGYFVRARATVRVGSNDALPVVWATRLDSLNYADSTAYRAFLGERAVISLDALEEEFIRDELPAVARGEPLHLAPNVVENDAVQELGRRASAIVTGELLHGARLSKEDATSVDALLARREANVETLRAKGLGMRAPRRLRLTPTLLSSLEQYDSDFVVKQLLKDDDQLSSYADAVGSAVELLAAHEETEFVPRLLLPQKDDGDRAILGAELLALAQPSKTPRLALWRTAQLFAGGAYGWRLGATMFEALFRNLGMASQAGGPVDAFAANLLAALEMDPEKVREGAGRAFAELFGQEPPAYQRTMP